MRKKMSKLLAMLLATILLTTTPSIASSQTTTITTTQGGSPKYVFYFIGDGLGASQRQLTEYYLQYINENPTYSLAMNQLEHIGMNTTHSMDSLITDSAAAGTALATGHKTNNGVISQTVEGKDLKTLVELAEESGMATGLITTTRLTHATPAVFASHNPSRNDENGIAEDYLDSGVDFFAGGGVRHFLPQGWGDAQKDAIGYTIKSKRTDERNLLYEFEKSGYKVMYGENGAESFTKEDLSKYNKVFAAFTSSHLPYEIDRMNSDKVIPSLATMVDKGIDVLSKDDDGFFLMVEAGRIDHACHANDVAGTLYDVIALDEAIKTALEFYNQYPEETLILVVGDHETGGMGMGFGKNYFIKFDDMKDVKVSVEDRLCGDLSYSGDREGFINMLKNEFALKDMSQDELNSLYKAMDIVDQQTETNPNLYGGYDPVAVEATHILSERLNIQWTTYAHTATAIPFSAKGANANRFTGYKDNTDIATTLADVLGFKLTPRN